jgi:CRP/FNR family transcriptional regulator, cyclic AMP receptor protein
MFINPRLYIFDGLTSDEVNYFALMCDPVDFAVGDIILNEWDASDDRAYFIEEWTVSVIKGQDIVATLGVGDLFGEIALITNDARTATIVAKSKVQALSLHRDDFLMLAKKSGRFPQIQQEIFRRIQENFKR